MDRLRRLGIPFVVAVALLAPLAYLPTYLQTGAGFHLATSPESGGLYRTGRRAGVVPVGALSVRWHLGRPDPVCFPTGEVARGLLARLRRPATLFWLLFLTSACAYLPLAVAFDPGSWASLGPFSFQVSRPLLYAVYFFVGTGLVLPGCPPSCSPRVEAGPTVVALGDVFGWGIPADGGCFLWALSRRRGRGQGPLGGCGRELRSLMRSVEFCLSRSLPEICTSRTGRRQPGQPTPTGCTSRTTPW